MDYYTWKKDILDNVDDNVCDYFPYAELIALVYTNFYNIPVHGRNIQFNRLLNNMLIRIKT